MMNPDAPEILSYCEKCDRQVESWELYEDCVCPHCALIWRMEDGDMAEAAVICADYGLEVPEAVALAQLDAEIAARLDADRDYLLALDADESAA
jgi:predicted RNA-binding Zn-ribbon protein involved in translation (DUF1610 family)